MKFDFSSFPLSDAGFSHQPMTIIDGEAKALLGVIMEIAILETGSRKAREEWQNVQLQNLLRHASQRSAFWRSRLGGKNPSNVELRELPILRRADVSAQVDAEGSMLRPSDGIPASIHSTSGSSGTPVRFFVSDINAQYNAARNLAQYFMEGRDTSLNRTHLAPGTQPGISVAVNPTWLGPLAPLVRSGKNKEIKYVNPDLKQIIKELESDEIGYLVCAPRILESIASSFDLSFLRRAGATMWIATGEHVSQELASALEGIPVRSNYSSEEVGSIGFECSVCPRHYHVATSNVIVEVVDASYEMGGVSIGDVLVTHLHSYATPFIRYDLGDLACLRESCPCGHDGQTLHAVYGRLNRFLKHRDGRLTEFHIRGQDLTPLAEFTEFRIRQTEFERIVVELGGRSELTEDEIGAVTAFLQSRAGQDFDIEVGACREIDWGPSRKRPGFRCEIVPERP